MPVGNALPVASVRCLRCPNRYARMIVLAKMKNPTGMPTPIPILVETGRPGEAGNWLVLGLGLGAVAFVLEEDFAAE